MKSESDAAYEYEVGGSLPPDSPTYVVRSVDDQLYRALAAGQLCYVLNGRQMGKSSLRVRTMKRLSAAGFACADVDLSIASSHGVTADTWYADVVDILCSRLGMTAGVDVQAWWREQGELSPVRRFAKFVEEVLLQGALQDTVVFFDEIDSVLSLDFGDDFFALLRSLYESASGHGGPRRLTFVLIGVASPAELIRDDRRSPFNIGLAIQLDGFTLAEAQPALLPGLARRFANPLAVLAEILAWTGGQPFLTQKLCRLAVQAASTPSPGGERAWCAELVRSEVISEWETHDEPVHLRTIRDRVLEAHAGQTGGLLGVYQRILEGKDAALVSSPEIMKLRLSGLVAERGAHLEVANPIYASIFNLEWVRNSLFELRPYAASLALWLGSNGTDISSLLTGADLRAAREWSAGKNLSDDDYQFLTASGDLDGRRVEEALDQERRSNELLRRATRKAQRRATLGSVILILTLIGAAATLPPLWQRVQQVQQQARTAAASAQAQRRKSRQLMAINVELERRRFGIERAIGQLRTAGEAARYLSAIGQDPINIRPAEVQIFRELSRSPEEVRLTFLRQGLASQEAMRRLENRLDLVAQAIVGLSSPTRDRVLGEVLGPCVANPSPRDSRWLCEKLAVAIGGLVPQLAKRILALVGQDLRSTSDPGTLEELGSLLPALARSLPSAAASGIFDQAVTAAERAIQLDRPRFRARGGASFGRALKDLARRLDARDHDHARRRILKAAAITTIAGHGEHLLGGGYRSFPADSFVPLWEGVLAAIPGSLPPQLRQEWGELPLGGLVGETTAAVAGMVDSDDAAAAFAQLVAKLSSSQGGSSAGFERALGYVGDKLTPDAAGTALLDAVGHFVEPSRDFHGMEEMTLLAAIRVTAARARTADVEQALAVLLTTLEDALRDLPARAAPAEDDDDSEPPLGRMWRLPRLLAALPAKYRSEQADRVLPRLIALLSQDRPGTMWMSTPDDTLGKILPAVAARTSADASCTISAALRVANGPRAVAPLIKAIAPLQSPLSADDAELVVDKALKLTWGLEGDRDLGPALHAIAQRVDGEASQRIATRVLGTVDRPKELPWPPASSLPFGRPMTAPPFPQMRATEPWEAATRKLSLVAEVLSGLPTGTVTQSAVWELWPVVAGALLCQDPEPSQMRMVIVSSSPGHQDCRTLAAAVRLLPGELPVRLAKDLAEAVGRRFSCGTGNVGIFRELMAKVASADAPEVDAALLRELEPLRGTFTDRCLLEGLAAQHGDLSLSQLEKVYARLLLDMPQDPVRQGLEPYGAFYQTWRDVVMRISPNEAERAFEFFASRMAMDDPLGARELQATAVRGVAPRVPPARTLPAFASIVRSSSQAFHAEADQALADSIGALPGKIPVPDLIDFLGQPQNVGPLRAATLSRLEKETGQSFGGDCWAVVAWARSRAATSRGFGIQQAPSLHLGAGSLTAARPPS